MRQLLAGAPIISPLAIALAAAGSIALSAIGFPGDGGILDALALSLAALAFACASVAGGRPPMTALAATGVPLALAGIVSLAFARNIWGIFGHGFDFGTVASLCLVAAAVAAGAAATTRERVIGAFALVILGLAVALASIAALFGLAAASFAAAAWPGAGLYCAIGLIAAGGFFERADEPRRKAVWVAAALVCGAGLAIQISAAAAIAFITAGAIMLGSAVFGRHVRRGSEPRIALVAGFLMLLCVSLGITESPLTVAEAPRPTITGSLYAIGPAFNDSLRVTAFGAGPASFGALWEHYRPSEWNALPFWNVTPEHPYSTFFELLADLGYAGAAAFLVLPAVLLWAAAPRARDAEDKTALVGIAACAIAYVFVYPAAMPIIVLGAYALGAVSAPSEVRTHSQRSASAASRIAIALLLIAAGLGTAYVASRQLRAIVFAVRARTHLAANFTQGMSAYDASHAAWPRRDVSGEESAAYVKSAADSLTSGDTAAAQSSLTHASDAIAVAATAAPRDASMWFQQASVESQRARLGDSDALPLMKNALAQAEGLAPSRPDLFLLQAEYALAAGDREAARTNAKKALSLKPDYAEARAFLASLDSDSGAAPAL